MQSLWNKQSLRLRILLCFVSVIVGIVGATVVYVMFLQNTIEDLMRPRYELIALRSRHVFRNGYHADIAAGKKTDAEEFSAISKKLKDMQEQYLMVTHIYTAVFKDGKVRLTSTSETPDRYPFWKDVTPKERANYNKMVALWKSNLYFPPSVHMHHEDRPNTHEICILQRSAQGKKVLSCIEAYAGDIEAVSGLIFSLFGIMFLLIFVGFLPLILLYRHFFSKKASILQDMVEQQTKQLKALLLKAEEASRVKSQFVANVSHELRTPLNAIVGFSEMMKEEMFGPVGNPNYREYVGLIYSSGVLLRDMINQILDVSKFEAGFMTLDKEWIDIKVIIDEAVLVISGYPEADKRVIKRSVSKKLPMLYTDKNLMMHIMLNMLSNAVKYTQEGGHIFVSAEQDETGALKIIFEDDGIGISAENQKKIFAAFVQVEGAQTKSHAGTGLGLYLVVQMLEFLNGRITVESREGDGSVFTLIFPSEIFRESGPRQISL